MKRLEQKGFTLVELMVVIAIIGLLAVALVTQAPIIQESARATKCKANLRALAQAAQNFGIQGGSDNVHRYPTAGSYEIEHFRVSGGSGSRREYRGHCGWVAWTKGETWPWGKNKDSKSDKSQKDGMEIETSHGKRAFLSVTNGALWGLVGKDASVYVCDAHKVAAQPAFGAGDENKIHRSYVMSAFFKYNDGNRTKMEDDGGKPIDGVTLDGRASARLMFAELPAQNVNTGERYQDSVLEYGRKRGEESLWHDEIEEVIGFNHKTAKRWVAHVAFVDGHVDGIILPKTAIKDGNPNYSDTDLKKLTKQLCHGQEIEKEIREKMK